MHLYLEVFFNLLQPPIYTHLPRQTPLSNKQAAREREEHYTNKEPKTLIDRPTITVSYSSSNSRVQRLDEVQTLTDSVDDRVDVFAVAEGVAESVTETLLNDRGGEGQANNGSEGAE